MGLHVTLRGWDDDELPAPNGIAVWLRWDDNLRSCYSVTWYDGSNDVYCYTELLFNGEHEYEVKVANMGEHVFKCGDILRCNSNGLYYLVNDLPDGEFDKIGGFWMDDPNQDLDKVISTHKITTAPSNAFEKIGQYDGTFTKMDSDYCVPEPGDVMRMESGARYLITGYDPDTKKARGYRISPYPPYDLSEHFIKWTIDTHQAMVIGAFSGGSLLNKQAISDNCFTVGQIISSKESCYYWVVQSISHSGCYACKYVSKSGLEVLSTGSVETDGNNYSVVGIYHDDKVILWDSELQSATIPAEAPSASAQALSAPGEAALGLIKEALTGEVSKVYDSEGHEVLELKVGDLVRITECIPYDLTGVVVSDCTDFDEMVSVKWWCPDGRCTKGPNDVYRYRLSVIVPQIGDEFIIPGENLAQVHVIHEIKISSQPQNWVKDETGYYWLTSSVFLLPRSDWKKASKVEDVPQDIVINSFVKALFDGKLISGRVIGPITGTFYSVRHWDEELSGFSLHSIHKDNITVIHPKVGDVFVVSGNKKYTISEMLPQGVYDTMGHIWHLNGAFYILPRPEWENSTATVAVECSEVLDTSESPKEPEYPEPGPIEMPGHPLECFQEEKVTTDVTKQLEDGRLFDLDVNSSPKMDGFGFLDVNTCGYVIIRDEALMEGILTGLAKAAKHVVFEYGQFKMIIYTHKESYFAPYPDRILWFGKNMSAVNLYTATQISSILLEGKGH